MTTPENQAFAEAALGAYDLPASARPQLISLSENATFLVLSDEGPQGILRVYRADYQSIGAMLSELAWISKLRESHEVLTPGVIGTTSGEQLLRVDVDGHIRACAMFEFVEGEQLGNDDMSTISLVGRTAAVLHNQVSEWTRPEWFERFTWNVEEILDAGARWGDWRNGPGHTSEGREILESAERKVRERLSSYPMGADNSGLVHCDLRDANLMQDSSGKIWVIDFDDCGFSWFLFDLCSTTTFIEHEPRVTNIVNAWLKGYREVRDLSPRDLNAIPDLVFLRRLHVLAWLGSHSDSDLARELGSSYTESTYDVARSYLNGTFLVDVKALTNG